MSKARLIAFYLPQFHPFPENDEWWGKGFTEWTNVGKAKPLFPGHYQPKVPSDLGYYDLRVPETRIEQAELAKEAGVDGFCYWHYWFGNGKELLERPFREVLNSGQPDFPFCLGWANESWAAKKWNAEKASTVKKILIEQQYGGADDYRMHFDSYLNAFKDHRYIRQDGKPIFLIYRPLLFNDLTMFMNLWNKWIKEAGVSDGFYFIGQADRDEDVDLIKERGFDAVTVLLSSRMQKACSKRLLIKRILNSIQYRLLNYPTIIDYTFCTKYLLSSVDEREDVIPSILSNWDHSPRSGKDAIVLSEQKPESLYEYAKKIFKVVKNKENKLVFLKSWNEWGEGNYMEPDLKYGKSNICALKKAKDNV